MQVGDLLFQIAEQGVTLRCGKTEDRLHYMPAGDLPPNLVAELKLRVRCATSFPLPRHRN